MARRDVKLLSLSYAAVLTSGTMLTASGPLAATWLGASPAVANLTVCLFLAGIAANAIPAFFVFGAFGRRAGFIIGGAMGMVGGLVGHLALRTKSLPLLLGACFLVGLSDGMGGFYRFAAIELSADEDRAGAVTLVLAGGVVAALCGPEIALRTRDAGAAPFSLTMLAMSAVGVADLSLVLAVRFKPDDGAAASSRGADAAGFLQHSSSSSAREPSPRPAARTVCQLATEPRFALAVATAALSYASMVMVMSPLTLAMTSRGFSFGDALGVMRLVRRRWHAVWQEGGSTDHDCDSLRALVVRLPPRSTFSSCSRRGCSRAS